MGIISVSLPSDGSTADVADYNTPITTIVNAINSNLDNDNISASAGIALSKLAQTAWSSWTPTFGNLSGGTITYAKYTQIGKTVLFRLKYTLGGAGIAGSVSFTLPVTAANGATNEQLNAVVYLTDTGVASYLGSSVFIDTASANIYVQAVGGTYGGVAALSSTVPHVWGNTDTIYVAGSYEAA